MSENNQTILIIDDEPAILLSYSAYLEDSGFNVLSANNGRIGLDILTREPIDLILVDLRMPEIDGLEVLENVTKQLPEIPVIVISGTGMITDVIEAIHKGAWDYLLKPISDFSHLNHAITKAFEKVQLKQENQQYQLQLQKMVDERTAELLNKTIALEKEISLRTKTEIKLSESLHEKNVLLQEVYHRVKNNMQVIIGLLDLQASKDTDAVCIQKLSESRNRIISMALVHEMLYKARNLADIDLKEYVQKLTKRLLTLHNKSEITINLDIQTESLTLNLEKAIPCGLIITELVTNSLKYAFPSQTNSDEIFITFSVDKSQSVQMTIGDNGVGLSDSINFETTESMGLYLVRILVEQQLYGTVLISRQNGTTFTITLPDL